MSAAVTLDFDRRPSALAYLLRGALPVRRRHELAPAITARWSGHRIDRRQLAAFLRATDLAAGPAAALLCPHTFGFRLAMAVLTQPAFPVPIWGVLQVRNHLLQHRAFDLDDLLDFETAVGAARIVPRGAEIDLGTRVRASGALAWESLVTFYARGRFGEPGPPSPLARAPAAPGDLVATWRRADEGHWQFGKLTGDYNGIHGWDWYARRFGFPSALYHPPRVLGQCLARLPALGAPQRLDAWLRGPVVHGAEVSLHAATAGSETTFALRAGAGDRPAILGTLRTAAPGDSLTPTRPRDAA